MFDSIKGFVKRKIFRQEDEFSPPELSMEGYEEPPPAPSGYPERQHAPTSSYPPQPPPYSGENLSSGFELVLRDLETIKANLETINERLDKMEEILRVRF